MSSLTLPPTLAAGDPRRADQPRVNVADRLASVAAQIPGRIAVARMRRRRGDDPAKLRPRYDTIRFAELDRQATLLAKGLLELGVQPGMRLALLVRPGVEFVALVFAALRSGATLVLVDPGLGRINMVRALAGTQPAGFLAAARGHALRTLYRGKFREAKLNVMVGRRWMLRGTSLKKLRALGTRSTRSLPHTVADDPAAIAFTSGSTGDPKGVLYTHGTFAAQMDSLVQLYGLEPGGVDLSCFPLFGLFSVAAGITMVLPTMDFSRPGQADPVRLIAAAEHWQATQSFASPAVWDTLSRHCSHTGHRLSTIRRVYSCGAPVATDVIERTLACVHPEAELFTPYGATEALPLSNISAAELCGEVAQATAHGAGVCVGAMVPTIASQLIRITDGPLTSLTADMAVAVGEIGELVVAGPQVSPAYVASASRAASTAEALVRRYNAEAKIVDGDRVWHRTGDVGYFDPRGRFWYCGRKSQRVVTTAATLYTACCEAVLEAHPGVAKAALVGVGKPGQQRAAMVIHRDSHFPDVPVHELVAFLKPPLSTCQIDTVLAFGRPLPTDIRHNAKIRREELAAWAAGRV